MKKAFKPRPVILENVSKNFIKLQNVKDHWEDKMTTVSGGRVSFFFFIMILSFKLGGSGSHLSGLHSHLYADVFVLCW